MFCPMHRLGFLFVYLIVGSKLCHAKKPGGRFLVEQNNSSIQYQVLMATFGDQLETESSFNVMLPPDDRYLCNFPNLTSINSTSEEITARIESIAHPIALLVPRTSPCSNQQRAKILLEMQKEISSMLKLLIVYEEEPKYMGYFLLLKPDDEPAPEELNDVSLTYIPFLELREFARRMEQFADGNDAFFLHPGNEDWSFIHTITGEWEPIGVNDRGERDSYSDDYYDHDDYDWIRYTLFSLLLVSPCIRAVYLFHAGGGRIHFRRNQAGWITGLQYIPPMPYWLSHGRPPRPPSFSSETLTVDQFNDLPEIIYEHVSVEEDDNVINDERIEESSRPDDELKSKTDLEMGDRNVLSKTSENPAPNHEDQEKPPDLSLASSTDGTHSDSDVENNDTAQPMISSLKTICTECTICIDDFEVGERLTLLPRCRHAFHKDCIRPWLLERQGCCPLCKMNVLQEDSVRTSSERETDTSSTVPRAVDLATIP